MYKLLGTYQEEWEKQTINHDLYFFQLMGVYVVRTLSLNDKHSCQLFRKASCLVLLSSSVSTANLSYLLATTFSSLRLWFSIFSFSRLILNPQPFFPLFFRLWSSVYSKFHICNWTFLFRHDKAALARSRKNNTGVTGQSLPPKNDFEHARGLRNSA